MRRIAVCILLCFAVPSVHAGNYAQDFLNGFNSVSEGGRRDREVEYQYQSLELMRQRERREQERHDLEMKILKEQPSVPDKREEEQRDVVQFYRKHPQYLTNAPLADRLVKYSLSIAGLPENRDKSPADLLEISHEEILWQDSRKDAEALWKKEQADFHARYPEYNKDQFLWDTLNAQVIRIAKKPENKNKSGADILLEAHREVSSRMTVKKAP